MAALDTGNRRHRDADQRLRSELIVWLTTTGPAGRLQTSPVWFLWDGELFHVYSRPGARKVRNIGANPRVSLHLDGDGTGGDVVVFEGTAELLDEPSADQVPAYVEKYLPRMKRNRWTTEGFARDYSAAIRITPTRARVW